MKSLKEELKEGFKMEIIPMVKWVGFGLLAGCIWIGFSYIVLTPVLGPKVAADIAVFGGFGPFVGFGVFLYKNATDKYIRFKRKLAKIRAMEKKALDPNTYKKS